MTDNLLMDVMIQAGAVIGPLTLFWGAFIRPARNEQKQFRREVYERLHAIEKRNASQDALSDVKLQMHREMMGKIDRVLEMQTAMKEDIHAIDKRLTKLEAKQ